jgi:hypothetical protein
MNSIKSKIIDTFNERHTDRTTFRPSELIAISDELGFPRKEAYKIIKGSTKIKHGVYNLEGAVLDFPKTQQRNRSTQMSSVQSISNDEVFVPEKDPYFIAWGHYKDVESIVKSGIFYPVYITGLSGNGKTTMVEQACSRTGRQYVRVQITPETDEDDLLGGFRLINGETVFSKGPVIKAMESGAVLLIDEIDRGSNKIMCLQGVLEGKPVLVKKTGEVITPAKGFNIIATANTKGKGSEDGRFIAANIIDEAFLERFTITLEQPYPTQAIEKRIILKHMEKFDCLEENFAEKLAIWSDTIRKTFEDGGLDELVSTRRVCHVVQSYSIFKDRRKAVELCVNRFDTDTKEAFIDLYSKVDDSMQQDSEIVGTNPTLAVIDDIIKDANP